MTIETTNHKMVTIDDADWPLVRQYNWYASKHHNVWYAHSTTRFNGRSHVKMHRLILAAKRGEQVDHINGDGLDNRRSNIRITDHAGNQQNQHKVRSRSGHLNIVITRANTFQVVVKRGGFDIGCGTYKDIERAIAARRAALNVFSFYGSDRIVRAVRKGGG